MKPKRQFFLQLTILILLLTSCRQDNYKLHIIFDKVDGLEEGAEVTFEGLKIGTVEKFSIKKDKILTTLKISKTAQIPTGSLFKIRSINLFGEKKIEVTFDSNVTTYYHDNDTAFGQSETSFFADTANVKRIEPLVDTLTNAIRAFGKNLTDDKKK